MRVIAIGDAHFPYVDRKAWALLLKVIQVAQPTHVIQCGDFGDQEAFAAHEPRFGSVPDPDMELKSISAGWGELEQAADDADVLAFLLGNHDIRVQRYVATKAERVASLLPDFHTMYGLSARVQVVDYQTPLRIGHVEYVHDVGHAGKHAAQQTLDATQRCTVFGHSHRAGVVYDGDVDGRQRRFCMNVGWLGDKNARAFRYVSPAQKRSWQHGVGLVDYSGKLAFAQFIPFVKGVAMVDGKPVRA